MLHIFLTGMEGNISPQAAVLFPIERWMDLYFTKKVKAIHSIIQPHK